jgi:hypothetical protein
LDKMRDEESKAFGDKAQFDHCLSAFLSAGRSAVYHLERKYPSIYPNWRKMWDAQHPTGDGILKSMHDRRDADVHAGGSGREVKMEHIKVGVGSSYSDKSGRLEVFGSPGPLIGADVGATIARPRYFFGKQSVVEACAEYLAVLEQMVAEFEAYVAGPPPPSAA